MLLALPASRAGRPGGRNDQPHPLDTQLLRTPDTRARIVGYLATAPVAAPGFRTDGVWVWPESLARQARLYGQPPPVELYEHLRRLHFLLPDGVPDDLLGQAAALAHSPQARAFAATDHCGSSGSSPARSTDLIGQWGHRKPPGIALRLARLFDAVRADGGGWFTPDRLRIPEPVRRERLGRYLDGGRLALRVPGEACDPLDPGHSVPLHYRTDGVWVWPQALSHFVRTRAVAPELEFLCHIEERGYVLPAVGDEAAQRARGAIRPPAPSAGIAPTYLSGTDGELIRVRGPAPGQVEMLREDLRWGPPPGPLDPVTRAFRFRVINEEQAAAELDARWVMGRPTPPLN
jgi:hypothetical protein